METSNKMTTQDLQFLERCVDLAREAVNAGDEPFGSILVNEKKEVIAEARNRVNEKNQMAHPEIELAKWACHNLTEAERKTTRMYTSGEHCPMCAAAHGWAGLGDIIYLSSAKQRQSWLESVHAPAPPINFIPIEKILKRTCIKGPAEGELLEQIKLLHLHYHASR